MNEMLEIVRSRNTTQYQRPSTQEKQLNFYQQPIPNVFSHFNPSYARVEQRQLDQY
jgi:hypothetical protein